MSKPIILADNRFRDGTLSATGTAPGYDVRNIRDGRDCTFWKGLSAGTNYLSTVSDTPGSANCIGFKSHNFHSSAALLSVESAPDEGGPWTERLAPFMPANDKAGLVMFPLCSDECWRTKIVTASVQPYVADLRIGVRIDFPIEPVAAPFVPFLASIKGVKKQTKYGSGLGSIVYCNPTRHEVSFPPIEDWDWINDVYTPFWLSHAGKLKSFFWAWNLSDFPEHVFYVTLPEDSQFGVPMMFFDRAEGLDLIMEGVMEEG